MKITKENKEKNRQKLVTTAVRLILEKGFRRATLREIAIEAGFAEPTIYNYFSSKEEIFYAYFEIKMYEARDRVEAIPDFAQYSFREKFQAFLETILELLEKEKEFVELAYESVFMVNWMGALKGAKPALDEFFGMIEGWMREAVTAKEFPDPPLRNLVQGLLWDYTLGITYYWLKDRSPKHTATTELIDRSLDLVLAGLKCDILNRGADLIRFLVREHLLSPLANGPSWTGAGQAPARKGRKP